MKLLLGLIIILTGVAILKYRHQIHEFTGEWGWANTYLWGNWTVVAIALIGMILIWIWTAYPFWVIDFNPGAQGTPAFKLQWTK